jgi:AbrB family looped-hinge helix DNA binding protein
MSALRKVGKRGTVALPAELRDQFGLHAGAFVAAEATGDGILLRPISSTQESATRQRFLDETDQAYAMLREDATAWEDELAERRALEGTLLDGLEEVDQVWLAGWLTEDTAPGAVTD